MSKDEIGNISDEERELLLAHRAKLAEERRKDETWAEPVSELNQLREGVDEEEGWASAATCFINRVLAQGWDDDDINQFTEAMMREIGLFQTTIRTHGVVWKSRTI